MLKLNSKRGINMNEKNQVHVHKKRENPLAVKQTQSVSNQRPTHAFLKGKKTLKTHGLNVLFLNKDLVQSLKSLKTDEPLSYIIEEAILKYVESLSPSEYKNLVQLLKERK